MNIKVCDCTLRDGGYINNWAFGEINIYSIIEKLQYSNLDIVEIGYIRDSVKYNQDITVFNSMENLNNFLSSSNYKKKDNTLLAAMIDFGDCAYESICNKSEIGIDILRITFKHHCMNDALTYIQHFQEKGYQLYIQPVSITSYTDDEFLNLIQKINKLKPAAMSIVDSYGVLAEKKLLHFANILENNLEPNIAIGFHSHNNLQLAFSNCIQLLKLDTSRDVILDSSLFGMGKNAGNCATELLCNYLNTTNNKNYNINEILDLINSQILKFSSRCAWGYQFDLFISAYNNCHPNYVRFLLNNSISSIAEIGEIIKYIPFNKRFMYDENYIGFLWNKFKSHTIK